MDIQVGLKNKVTIQVTQELTAEALGSGLLPVYATPAMVALIEGCAKDSLVPFLETGEGTVGVFVNLVHLLAMLMGNQVICVTIVLYVARSLV